MKIDIKIREDLWKAIQAHYERNDYTEAVRDAVFHMSEVLREKGSIEDKDGSKLVDAALLGNNPAILVSKNETTTEKASSAPLLKPSELKPTVMDTRSTKMVRDSVLRRDFQKNRQLAAPRVK